MNKAVFLDRDGTINIDPGYIGNPNLVKLYPSVAEGIKLLKDDLGFYVIVISNQSGITRGLITLEDVNNVNEKINHLLAKNNTEIDAFYFCPFHPDFDSSEKCNCRKPSPQMVFNAGLDFDVDLKQSFFIGDKKTDIQCGINSGLSTILIKNTINQVELNELINSENSPNFICDNFFDAVKYIEENIDGDFIEK